ncbi:hypothetical protein WN943_003567 [Citrus x changshan-huyou]
MASTVQNCQIIHAYLASDDIGSNSPKGYRSDITHITCIRGGQQGIPTGTAVKSCSNYNAGRFRALSLAHPQFDSQSASL